MKQYLDLIQCVLNNGDYNSNRTSVGAYSCFGTQTRYDMSDGQREWEGAGWRWEKGDKTGTSVIVSTIKIKLKKKSQTTMVLF